MTPSFDFLSGLDLLAMFRANSWLSHMVLGSLVED